MGSSVWRRSGGAFDYKAGQSGCRSVRYSVDRGRPIACETRAYAVGSAWLPGARYSLADVAAIWRCAGNCLWLLCTENHAALRGGLSCWWRG